MCFASCFGFVQVSGCYVLSELRVLKNISAILPYPFNHPSIWNMEFQRMIMVATIIALASGKDTGDPQPRGEILNEELGVILSPNWYLLQTTENIIFSMFLKVENPVSVLYSRTQACPSGVSLQALKAKLLLYVNDKPIQQSA